MRGMHYIYLVELAIDKFDPITDLPVSEDSFLTWRRWDQRLPNTQNTLLEFLIFGRGLDGKWFIGPSGPHQHTYPGIDAWLDRTAIDAEHGRLGIHKMSEYYGLFAPLRGTPGALQMHLNVRIERFNQMVKLHPELGLGQMVGYDRKLAPAGVWRAITDDALEGLLLHANLAAA